MSTVDSTLYIIHMSSLGTPNPQ